MNPNPDLPSAATAHHTRGACPACGRRFRAKAERPPAPLPLFAWNAAPPRRPEVRIIMLHHLADPDGMPLPGIIPPGSRVPIPFRSMNAARVAKAAMEALA